MNVLTTTKINFEQTFNSKKSIVLKKRLKSKGKQSWVEVTKPLNELKEFIPYCQLVIDRILHFQKQKAKGLVNINRNIFINLPSKYLISLLGNELNKITTMSILTSLGVINTNHNYSYRSEVSYEKPFSKSYKIHEDYYSGIISEPGYALNTISRKETPNSKGYVLNTKKEKGKSRCTYPNIISYTERVMEKLGLSGDVTINNSVDWLFSPITQMPGEERKTLRDDNGNELIEIDMKSAHLQFFIKVISDYLGTDSGYLPLFGENGYDYFEHEFKGFKKLVLSGMFYDTHTKELKPLFMKNKEVVAHKYFIEKGKDYYREQTKKITMCWLASSQRNKSVKYLRETYPQITHLIDHINEGTRNKLLCKLMKMEACTVNFVTDHLATNYPDSVCASIFDGFVVEQEHADLVHNLLKEKAFEILGFDIGLKTSTMILHAKKASRVYDFLPC
jgi:hypothetical protein